MFDVRSSNRVWWQLCRGLFKIIFRGLSKTMEKSIKTILADFPRVMICFGGLGLPQSPQNNFADCFLA